MDALFNVPMEEVLSEIPVDEAIKNALLGLPSRFRPIFDVVLDYESGTWKQLAHSARAIGLHENFLPDLYLQSLKWVNEILLETSRSLSRKIISLLPPGIPRRCEMRNLPREPRNKQQNEEGLRGSPRV
jgi:hypothetical protein